MLYEEIINNGCKNFTMRESITSAFKMFKVLYYLLFTVVAAGDNENKQINLRVKNVANKFISSLGKDNERIKELKDKIEKINLYVIDKDKYAEYLTNEVKSTDLNSTSFFNSLNEPNDFNFLTNNESKSLYLKIKQKMNRDDVIKVLSEGEGNSRLIDSARNLLRNQIGSKDDIAVGNVIDKFIAHQDNDSHTYKYYEENGREWDPQVELEELKEYHKHDSRRIFKGEKTTIKLYPFMVSIHVMGRFWCGGSIYSSDLILTSAACLQLLYNNRFFRENPESLFVRVGSNHSRIGGEKFEALEVYFHPGYNPKTLRHNIAVIRLARHIFFTRRRVPKKIEISHNDKGVPVTSEVLVLGWGVTKISQKLPYQPIFLNRKVLPVYPNAFCKEVYGKKFITRQMFCAGTFTTGEGACDHDAGGPAILAGKLVGIISFGPAVCGYPNAPTVFTLVGAYADWIESIDESMPLFYVGKSATTKARRTSKTNKRRRTTHPDVRLKVSTVTTYSDVESNTPEAAEEDPPYNPEENTSGEGLAIDME
ncbi:transmembrane protease serine 11A-like [Aricia agestis]|uniref:transmembrane protease serine 11A-like n=1 Tax=Aricia agestis TaxID=91739 RepID=UPI001C20482A|nr:transmembrane protease serine 11A-like [Aricia agestis]